MPQLLGDIIARMDESDFELFDRWCKDDKEAGTKLFHRYHDSLFYFFEHKARREGDDLVQETFLQCMKSRDRFARQSSFRTYLFAIAKNVLFQHWRSEASARNQVNVEDVTLEAMGTSIGGRIAKREDRARVIRALRTLPLGQQALLEMFYWHDLGREQLAEVFDVEPATIGSRLFRARQALQEALESPPPDDSFDEWARGLSKDGQDL